MSKLRASQSLYVESSLVLSQKEVDISSAAFISFLASDFLYFESARSSRVSYFLTSTSRFAHCARKSLSFFFKKRNRPPRSGPGNHPRHFPRASEVRKTPPGSISGPVNFQTKSVPKVFKNTPHLQSDNFFVFFCYFLLTKVGSGPARPGLDLAGPSPDQAWTWPGPGSGPAQAPVWSKTSFMVSRMTVSGSKLHSWCRE